MPEMDFLDRAIEVSTVSVNQSIQISLLLIQEINEDFPRAFDDLETTVRFQLTNEVYHFCHDNANFVPFRLQLCMA